MNVKKRKYFKIKYKKIIGFIGFYPLFKIHKSIMDQKEKQTLRKL